MRISHRLQAAFFVVVFALCHGFAQARTSVEKTTWRDFEAFRLSDGKTEAIIVPALSGRVMSFGAVGGRNWLWNAPPEALTGDGYKNWGGDKTFVGPHGLWSTFAPSIWPPQPSWDGLAHRVEELEPKDGDDTLLLRTISPTWSGFGVVIYRSFGFNEAGEFVVSQRLEKVSGEPRLISIWQVAQVAPTDAVFIPLSPQSAYKNGFHLFGTLPAGAKVETVSSVLLRITPTTGKNYYKLGADAPVAAIAAVKDGVALVLRAAKPKGQYPDGAERAGFPVEFYNHSDEGAGQYSELELLSPMRRFVRGSAWTHTVRWSLHALAGKDLKAEETQSEIAKLLAP